MIKLTPLFSGSKGNCTLVQTPRTNVLLDAGFGYRQIVARLAQAGLSPEDISAVFITHEHSDHISALPQLVKYGNAKIFVPALCTTYIAQNCFGSDLQTSDGGLDFEDFHVDAYRCSHDSRACLGYRFVTKDDCVASVTDTGIATEQLVQFLSPCRTVILESNHDAEMLKNGPYPYFLKQRIASELGHLSNKQAAQVISRIVHGNVQNIVLAHLSEQNNTPKLTMESAVAACNAQGKQVGKDIFLYVAQQSNNEVSL